MHKAGTILRNLLAVSLIVGASLASTIDDKTGNAPTLEEIDQSKSELRTIIDRYVADRGSLIRSYPVESSPARQARFRQFYSDWLTLIARMNFDAFTQDGKADYVLFRYHLEHEQKELEIRAKSLAETAALVPFAQSITDLAEARRKMEKLDPARAAAQIDALNRQIESTRRSVESGVRTDPAKIKKSVGNRAVMEIAALRGTLRGWYTFYNAYDPLFTWWVDEPYKAVDQSLQAYAAFLTEKVVGLKAGGADTTLATARPGGRGQGPGPGADGDGGRQRGGFGGGVPQGARAGDSSDIVGDPIGRDALMVALASEMIPYTPEELIAIGYKELDWCEKELKKAAKELGFGDDWHKALEHVKNKYVEPGKQPEMIKDLAYEAIDYLEKNNLITIPPLARESWRMEMMSPERQLVNPFFTGGEVISVSYPVSSMSHEQKMMTMRGNNPHFSKATVHHELIPGTSPAGFHDRAL